MWNRILRRGALQAIYYCAIVLIMSTTSWDMATMAQSVNVDKLIGQLGKGGVRSGGQNPRGAATNQRRTGGAELPDRRKVVPRHFQWAHGDRLVIRRFCSRKIDASDELLIGLQLKFSRLEMDFCRRIGEESEQFGYDIFGGIIDEQVLSSGAIQDHYIIGEGDELVVSFYGRQSGSDSVFVDREGRILIRDLPPVVIVGMTFGELRRWLEATVKQKMIGTQVFLSLGTAKSISVTVSGEVVKPGRFQLSALSSVLDAFMQVEGIKKTGSLRRIQIIRGDQIFWVDLYDLLLSSGFSQKLTLSDGDAIVVPLIGDTIAIDGFVNRPGIYELAEGEKTLSVAEALNLAGNGVRPRGNFVRVTTFDEQGKETSHEQAEQDGVVRGGDILSLVRSEDIQVETVELLGHVRVPGKRSLNSASTVKDLVRSQSNLMDNPYLLFAVLETTDPATRARRNFAINLRRVLADEENFALRDGDRLIVLSTTDIGFLISQDVQSILRSKPPKLEEKAETVDVAALGKQLLSPKKDQKQNQLKPISSNSQLTRKIVQNLIDQNLISLSAEKRVELEKALSRDEKSSCQGLLHLSFLIKSSGNHRFRNALQDQVANIKTGLDDFLPCPRIFNSKPSLLPFALEHIVAISGEVRSPGAYPVTNNTNLSSLVALAGGMTRDVSLAQLEISRFQAGTNIRETVNLSRKPMNTVLLNPGDTARFNAVYVDRETGPVRLRGEFVRPGLYDIRRGERLSEVIARAGGLTKQAYPYGSIFTRESVKAAQKVAFQRAARELRSAAIYAGGKSGTTPLALAALKDLTEQIESVEPLGRVVMEADPTVLQVRPEFDTVLEAGDQIFVPKRPNSVLVIGDVLNPGALQFIAGSKVDQYVSQAGGFQQSADEDRMYLVFPNGVAQPISVSVWNYNPVQVPPGSTVVVPKDPAPLNLFTFAKDMTALISQMAITAASLAVISNN